MYDYATDCGTDIPTTAPATRPNTVDTLRSERVKAHLQMVSERHILEADATAGWSASTSFYLTLRNDAHLHVRNVGKVRLFRLSALSLQLVASPVLADIPQPVGLQRAASARHGGSAALL